MTKDLLTPRIIRATNDMNKARANLKRAMSQVEELALEMLADGWSEQAVSQAFGISRMTVRKWVGK